MHKLLRKLHSVTGPFFKRIFTAETIKNIHLDHTTGSLKLDVLVKKNEVFLFWLLKFINCFISNHWKTAIFFKVISGFIQFKNKQLCWIIFSFCSISLPPFFSFLCLFFLFCFCFLEVFICNGASELFAILRFYF